MHGSSGCLLVVHRAEGRQRGPALLNLNGTQSSSSQMNAMFIDSLIELYYEESSSRFGLDIKPAEDVSEQFHVFRSLFRRGSESRAVAVNVSKRDRYVVNRWRMTETVRSGRASQTTDQHYVDMTLVAPSFLRYMKSM